MMKFIVLFALLACSVSAQGGRGDSKHHGGGSSSDCRYWCKTPEGQAYCCENDNQKPGPVGVVKRGDCPPVRPQCPASRFGPPKSCSHDGVCPGIEKCCFDRCLEQHVCKKPQ